uniref:Replication factor A C-terminal domain-containing protein n=1 Tax=Chenopodium quinoa TaxID=63459 RepID=A0A803LA30_CHEQI
MKPELLFLSELSPGVDDYRIKVKVVDISDRKLSTDDCTFYETLLFCDEKQISSISQDIREDVRYDVLGVVLFVEEEVRLVTSFYGQKAYVREVVITDQTNTQPIIINVWNHLAGNNCEQLKGWAEKFIVVGFTSVRPSNIKGFSMSAEMYSHIIYDPKGDRANVLREWSSLYTQMLLDRQARILEVRDPASKKTPVTVQYLKEKKVQNALQDERHWILASVSFTSMEQLEVYVGCSVCGKTTKLPEGRQFACSKCYTRETIACLKVALTFNAVDAYDNISLTAFGNETEQIFGMNTTDIYNMMENENLICFTTVQQKIRSKVFCLKVSPSPTLTATNILQWTLEAVQIDVGQGDCTALAKEAFPNWSLHRRARSSLKRKQCNTVSDDESVKTKICIPNARLKNISSDLNEPCTDMTGNISAIPPQADENSSAIRPAGSAVMCRLEFELPPASLFVRTNEGAIEVDMPAEAR